MWGFHAHLSSKQHGSCSISRRGVAAEQVTPFQLKEARNAVVCTPSYLCHSLNLGLEA